MTPTDSAHGKELTWRGVALGVALTVLFTAANIYLGLKLGITFATSLPAAVISMAVLGLFPGSNILENNIVQTVCSSAGGMASIIFVLPGMNIVGWWVGFPFWTCFLAVGGGRRAGCALHRSAPGADWSPHSDLPYPEGVGGRRSAARRIGSPPGRRANPEAREGLMAVIHGTVASAALSIATAMRLAVDEADGFFRLGAGATGYTFSFSLRASWARAISGESRSVSPWRWASPSPGPVRCR